MRQTSPIPPRSRLYQIRPKGQGTSQVESLTGYICRLAREHVVTPSALLHRELEWWDSGQPENVGKWRRRTAWLKLRPSIDACPTGERWVTLLERLTCSSGLAGCTIRNWADLFPTRQLLRATLAWCPECLAEDEDPYHRLLWGMAPVSSCVRHQRHLVGRCPSCHSRVPAIHPRSVPGLCTCCEASLSKVHDTPQPADEFDIGMSKLMADFLAETSACPGRQWVRLASAPAAISLCMAAAGLKDAAELARALNVSRITTWYWLNGKSEPTLYHTLRLCFCLNLSLADFLAGAIPKEVVPRGTGELLLRPSRKVRKDFDEVNLANQINTFRAKRSETPPSLEEVGRETGFPPRILRRHFPRLCTTISKQHKDFCREALRLRRNAQKRSFRDAIRQCRREMLHPKRCDVVQFLPKPGVLRSAAARQMLDQLILNLP